MENKHPSYFFDARIFCLRLCVCYYTSQMISIHHFKVLLSFQNIFTFPLSSTLDNQVSHFPTHCSSWLIWTWSIKAITSIPEHQASDKWLSSGRTFMFDICKNQALWSLTVSLQQAAKRCFIVCLKNCFFKAKIQGKKITYILSQLAFFWWGS